MSREKESGKLEQVADKGQSATCEEEDPGKSFCLNCLKPVNNYIMCGKCDTGRFCSVLCAQSHENHNKYCEIISSVQAIEHSKHLSMNSINITDSEKLPLKLKKKLISLVGEKPIAKLFLDNVEIEGLWDTGAMVSMMSRDFLQEHFPGTKIEPLEDFIKHKTLKVNAANQTQLELDGVVVFDFGTEQGKDLFRVPCLVTPDTLSSPIIGYNIIEYLVMDFKDINMPLSLSSMITSLSVEKAEAVVDVITAGGEISEISREAKLSKNYTIPSNTRTSRHRNSQTNS